MSRPGFNHILPGIERLISLLEEPSEKVDNELGKLISKEQHTTVNLMVHG